MPSKRHPGLPDPAHLAAQEQVEAVAARVGHGLAQLASDIREMIESAVPSLRDADLSKSLREASIRQNVDTMLGILAHGIDPAAVDPPSAAVELARNLGQRGITPLALARAYRIGQREFLSRLIEDLVRHNVGDQSEARATLEMVQRVSDYVDHTVEELLRAYAKAREEWLNPNAILAARVRSVLYDKTIDADSAAAQLSYRLRQHHLALEVWVGAPSDDEPRPSFRRIADALAAAAGSAEPALLLPRDESNASVWLPLGAHAAVKLDRVAEALAALPGTFVAAGEPGTNLAGFRRTHQQALGAKVVALVRTTPLQRLTRYAEVAPIVTMSADLGATRAWVRETLGALAIDDERHERLRETVRVFFASGGSYAVTAEKLQLHRNTAHYRIRKAEEVRGRPFSRGRLDLELALLACRWFGPAVLRPA